MDAMLPVVGSGGPGGRRRRSAHGLRRSVRAQPLREAVHARRGLGAEAAVALRRGAAAAGGGAALGAQA
eukprot:6202118-Pleurochrysis_carterae.AAC.1